MLEAISGFKHSFGAEREHSGKKSMSVDFGYDDGKETTLSDSPLYSWSALPGDLLSHIAETLDTRIDVLRFRAVCQSWRSSIPLPSKNPQAIILPYPSSQHSHLNPNLVTECTIYALQAIWGISKTETKTWIIKVQESPDCDKVILRDPLSKFPVFKDFGSYLPKSLNLLNYKIVEISKGYDLGFVDGNNMEDFWIGQVAVSSSLNDRFVIMVLDSKGKLSVWRMGDKEWTNVKDNRAFSKYDYISFHNGKFFAIDRNGFTLIIDPVSLEVSSVNVINSSCFSSGFHSKFLVKSVGDLFLVDRKNDHDPIIIRIYKFHEENCNWVEVNELNDVAFVISPDFSFYISTKHFTGCKGNCVYFFDLSSTHPSRSAVVYDLANDTALPLSKFPGFSEIFLPSPTWLRKKRRVSQINWFVCSVFISVSP